MEFESLDMAADLNGAGRVDRMSAFNPSRSQALATSSELGVTPLACRIALLMVCVKPGAAIPAENGATAHQLMALCGWTTIKQAEGYTQKANRERLASDAMHLLMPATGERKQL